MKHELVSDVLAGVDLVRGAARAALRAVHLDLDSLEDKNSGEAARLRARRDALVAALEDVSTGRVTVEGSNPTALSRAHRLGVAAPTVTAVSTPGHGTATVTPAGDVVYTPADDFSGTDAFDYTVTDGQGRTDTATVTVTVAPRASDDSADA